MSVSTKKMDAEQITDNTPKQSCTEVDAQIEEVGAEFTPEEQQVLASLRTRYQQGLDLFNEREIVQLRFMRWLYQKGYFPRPRGTRGAPRRARRPRKASAQPDA